MEKTNLYDITDVCRMLGTTSRTLRFYEEKGIITSTLKGLSSRRCYTEVQVSHIRNVLVLRTLGLSLKTIVDLQENGSDLKSAVLSKRAEIYASIDSRIKEIHLLNEALSSLESGKNIFHELPKPCQKAESNYVELAKYCTEAILNNDDSVLYRYIGSRLAEYLPKEIYRTIRRDTFAPIGDFLAIEQIEVDAKYPNILHSKNRFSKLGLRITFVFYGGKIDGLWFGYYDLKER